MVATSLVTMIMPRMKMSLERLVVFVKRNKNRVVDFGLVIALVAAVVFVALVADIFANSPGYQPAPSALEVDELIAIAAVFLGGMFWAYARLRRERQDAARREAVTRQIHELAYSDALTGLPNRRSFDEALRAAVGAPPRAGASHGLFMIDLNGFKRVNDVYGHGTGDEVLMQIAGRLGGAVREKDLVARLGGDEFAVLATHLASPEAATGLALRMIESLEKPIEAGRRDHLVGAAIGIALMPQDSDDCAELMRKADVALYRAKGQPQSAMRFFEPEMDAHVKERDALERALRRAIEQDEIQPAYQPIVDVHTGDILGFEALAKWTHPEWGEVPPERFVPVAEDSALIGPLTDGLLRKACRDAGKWPDAVGLSFNVSPLLLRDPGFGTKVVDLLSDEAMPAGRIEIEITESALVRDLEAVTTALAPLRDAGVRIAHDDFGTGYSSLYHLRNFKVDRIKIDRSFVEKVTSDRDSAAIVQALVGLGSGMGMQVAAAGVETPEQRDWLEGHGCHFAQGHLCGRAVDAGEAMTLLGTAAS